MNSRMCSLLTWFVIVIIPIAVPVSAETLHVPAEYPTIQSAIDASADGDTVLVAPGEYAEDINFNGKAITIRSSHGPLRTRLEDGSGGVGSVVTFDSGEDGESVLEGFTIHNGSGTDLPAKNRRCGGGILCLNSSPTIIGNVISGNQAEEGGGIYCENSSGVIAGNIIQSNDADGTYNLIDAFGGGVCLENCGSESQAFRFSDNLVMWNNAIGLGDAYESLAVGGGLFALDSTLIISQCTFVWNEALCDGYGDTFGGGACLSGLVDAAITNSIFHGNRADIGSEIALGYGVLFAEYSNVQGGLDGVWNYSGDIEWGEGMLDVDPHFVGVYSLSQVEAGQSVDSPCVDAGNPLSPSHDGSTRTDLGPDQGVVDMGFHYPADWPRHVRLLAGAGPGENNPPVVRLLPVGLGAEPELDIVAYGVPRYGVNVTTGRMVLDGFSAEILTGAGPGDVFGPHVRGFSVYGEPLPGLSFLAYGTNRYGVNVAAGNLDGDWEYDEIVTGAGPGAVFGPHVRAFDYDGGPGVAPLPGVSFFAYGTPKWGVNVACGDIDGDYPEEIVTGAGPGAIYGPHVRGWRVENGQARPMSSVSFLAYGTQRMGVRVTCGDLDGDGIAEVVTAPGPSPVFGAHIRGWNCDGEEVTRMPGVDFLAWPAEELRHGATVFAGCDVNQDGTDDLVVGAGPDPDGLSRINVYRLSGDGVVTLWYSLQAFPDDWTHGVNVAAGLF